MCVIQESTNLVPEALYAVMSYYAVLSAACLGLLFGDRTRVPIVRPADAPSCRDVCRVVLGLLVPHAALVLARSRVNFLT